MTLHALLTSRISSNIWKDTAEERVQKSLAATYSDLVFLSQYVGYILQKEVR